jgi:hypothetical protein
MAARSGSVNPKLVLLLVLLIGAGGWNFHKNTQLENAAPRPFRSYSDADLEQLISQYQGEMGVHAERYQQVANNSTVRVKDRGMLGDQIDEFERVQQISRRQRSMATQVADRQIALDQIQLEESKRETDRPIYRMIFRRMFTF